MDIPSNLLADSFKYFDPMKEFGFPVDRLPRYRSNTVKNLSPLTTQEACSLFHNFNGIDVEMSVTTAGLSFYGQTITPKKDDNFHMLAELNEPITLENIVQPKQRYLGAIVNNQGFGYKSDSDGYTSVSGFVQDPTQFMNAFFNNEPPQNSMEGLRGFGMRIFGATLRGQTSRGGGFFHQTVDWANWDVEPNFGYYSVYDNRGKRVSVNSWDGSYQKYLNAQDYDLPGLKPTVTAEINRIRKVLVDPGGQQIGFTETTCTETIVTKDKRYNEEGELVGVWNLPFPKGNFSVQGAGRFFKYG